MKQALLWVTSLVVTGCVVDASPEAETTVEQELGSRSGADLFARETFGGNGRTCSTCHTAATGTLDAHQAQTRFAANPSDPLFRALDSDGGLGVTYTRILTNATIRVTLPLPSNVRILELPDARTITLNRGIPTVNNVALEPVLMQDGRESELPHQAISAVHAHYQNLLEPTASEATRIADFERGLFSSNALQAFAEDPSAVPVLPPGTTDSERRGRTFFVAGPRGLCAMCHSGPMLNTTNDQNILQPANSRFSTAFVSEFNTLGNPTYTFQFALPDGRTITMQTPDPGRGLATGNPCNDVTTVCNDVTGFATFKIPTLFNVRNTAPYFHDNSAATLEALMDHYERFFALNAAIDNAPQLILSPQDKADILAYLRLL